MRTDVILEDTTLRDGEQAPGVALGRAAKLAVFEGLIAAGVRWIEAGIPAMGGEEVAALRAMLDAADGVQLIAWNRGVRDDVAYSLDLGFRAVHIGLPASDVLLRNSVGRTRTWLLQQAADLVRYAKDRGAFVSISAEDVGRAEIPFLQHYAATVWEAGADRLRLSDTIGVLTPEGYGERVAAIVRACPIDLQCHTHNDFGLGVANTLAGLHAGARYFHCTINGIGERAGLPDLAQMAMSLQRLYGIDLGIDSTQLTGLSDLMAQVSGHEPLPWQPLVGRNAFAHESGIHVSAMLHDPSTFEPLQPEAMGASRQFVLGKHTGRAAIASALGRVGLVADPQQLRMLVDAVRDLAIAQGGALTTGQLVELYHRAIKVA